MPETTDSTSLDTQGLDTQGLDTPQTPIVDPGAPEGAQKKKYQTRYRSSFPGRVRRRIARDRNNNHMTTHAELAKMLDVSTDTIPAWVKVHPDFAAAEHTRYE